MYSYVLPEMMMMISIISITICYAMLVVLQKAFRYSVIRFYIINPQDNQYRYIILKKVLE